MSVLMPALKDFVANAITFIQKLRTMDEDTKKLILKVVAIAAAIGPVIMAIGALSMALGAVLSPIGLIILAIGALGTAAILVWKNWEKVSGFLKDLWLDIADFATRIFMHIKVAVMTPIREVLEFILSIASTMKKAFKNINIEGLENALAKVNGKIDESRDKLADLREQGYRTTDDFKGFGERVKNLAGKVADLAVKFKDLIIDGINLGDVVGGISAEMDAMAESLNQVRIQSDVTAESVRAQAEAWHKVFGETGKSIEHARAYGETMESLEGMNKRLKNQAEELADKIFPYWGAAWEDLGNSATRASEVIINAFKKAIGDLLMALSREALVRALIAVARLQFGRAAAWFAASAAAGVGAGFVRSLATGGEFVTNGPETILVGDNPSGRERVTVEPLSGGEGGDDRIIDNRIYIDGTPLFKLLTRATKSGELPIHRRAILT
jgi:hypothetical protein